MSQIKTTEIEGNVAVSRHAVIGGDATVQGNTLVKKNLRVEGWLEARNIKGAQKGVFLDPDSLKSSYPRPHAGWWAIVGGVPGEIWVADSQGKWHNTERVGGEPSVDTSGISGAIDDCSDRLDAVESDVSEMKPGLDAASKQASDAYNMASTLGSGIGRPGGIASLDQMGMVPESQLPVKQFLICEFSGLKALAGSIAVGQSSEHSSTDERCMVYFDPLVGQFYLDVVTDSGSGGWVSSAIHTYYGDWADASDFGVVKSSFGGVQGVEPSRSRLYKDRVSGILYWWNGRELCVFHAPTVLGTGSGEAYPGTSGLALEGKVEDLRARDSEIAEALGGVDGRVRDGVGVVPFDGFIDAGSVVPSDGVWFVRTRDMTPGYFSVVHSVYGYVEGDYNVSSMTSGRVCGRSDRLFRLGSALYRFDGMDLSEFSSGSGSGGGVCGCGLTQWQKEFLKQQEEAERLNRFSVVLAAEGVGSEFTGESVVYDLTATTRYDGSMVDARIEGVTENLQGAEFVSGRSRCAVEAPRVSKGAEVAWFGIRAIYSDDAGEIKKSATVSHSRYAPMRILSLGVDHVVPTAEEILQSEQKYVKGYAAGSYSVSFRAGEYVWVCVPEFMSVKSFTSSGFMVPMERAVVVSVGIGGTMVNYRCYRTSGAPKTPPMDLTIGG